MKALGDNVILQVIPNASATPGGIHLPDMCTGKSNKGTFVGGSTPFVHTGDTVIFERGMGYELEDGDKVFVIIDRKYLLANLSR